MTHAFGNNDSRCARELSVETNSAPQRKHRMATSVATPPPAQKLSDNDVQAIDELRETYARLRAELGRVIVGQKETIERLAICLFARGHALLMGVPGLAKTLLVSKVAETMSLKFSRIQFTPDLMPMDIT